MTWIKDLKRLPFFSAKGQRNVLAVGWLSSKYPFPKGPCPSAVLQRLQELSANPWQPMVAGGMHDCELCQNHSDGANLFIPHNGRLYIAPRMVAHYIDKHAYLPPDEFCKAVLACPPMNSEDYILAMKECDLPAWAIPLLHDRENLGL